MCHFMLINFALLNFVDAADRVPGGTAHSHYCRQLRHLVVYRDDIHVPEVAHEILHHASGHCRYI